MKPKIIIIAAGNNFHFINDLVPALSDSFDIKMRTEKDCGAGAGWREMVGSDLLWLEWADGSSLDLLKILSQSKNFSGTKALLRLHRYELFTPITIENLACLSKAAISKIDQLVFVSHYVKQIGVRKFPWMDNGKIVPNLIDTDKFPFVDREKGYNILMLGRISYVKNIPLALTMFHELLKLDSNYKLHIVGEVSDPELRYYAGSFMSKARLHSNVFFHGRMPNEDLPKFMKEMHYILCSSIFEAQGVGILEAMCSGLKPVIFDFPGAETIFPGKWRWIDRTGFVQNIMSRSYYPSEYHDFVMEKYSIQNNIHLYRDLITETLNKD